MTRYIRLRTLLFTALLANSACSLTDHPTSASPLGEPISLAEFDAALAAGPGQLEVRSVPSATWQVPRSGLINLEHPRARAAGLTDTMEPIEISVHVISHPSAGTFLIDSGVAATFSDGPSEDLSWVVRRAMDLSTLTVRQSTRALLTELGTPVAGVFLTHLHLDHIMGIGDLPPGVPLYTGPGDAAARAFEHAFSRGTNNRLLARGGDIQEWAFGAESDDLRAVDVFGDGQLFALSVPGHTPGSTAYLARAVDGLHLYVGDASHTVWGWENGVEPGRFSADIPRSARSLAALKALAARYPTIHVYPGHQSIPRSPTSVADFGDAS
ncbi:MAG: MBL fold metallo-hydrolase [Pseudomonadota bacterium]